MFKDSFQDWRLSPDLTLGRTEGPRAYRVPVVLIKDTTTSGFQIGSDKRDTKESWDLLVPGSDQPLPQSHVTVVFTYPHSFTIGYGYGIYYRQVTFFPLPSISPYLLSYRVTKSRSCAVHT